MEFRQAFCHYNPQIHHSSAMTYPVLQGTLHQLNLPKTAVAKIPLAPTSDLGGFSLTPIISP